MKYILAQAEGWVHKIGDDGSMSASFTESGAIGKKMWAEYQEWLSEGNQVNETITQIDSSLPFELQRQLAYPPVGDQLDYIFHNGLDAWKTDIVQPVKDQYPKP